jgi:hypothetical protein
LSEIFKKGATLDTVEKMIEDGKYKEAYLRLSTGEECDEIAAEECRMRIEGVMVLNDNKFVNLLVRVDVDFSTTSQS